MSSSRLYKFYRCYNRCDHLFSSPKVFIYLPFTQKKIKAQLTSLFWNFWTYGLVNQDLQYFYNFNSLPTEVSFKSYISSRNAFQRSKSPHSHLPNPPKTRKPEKRPSPLTPPLTPTRTQQPSHSALHTHTTVLCTLLYFIICYYFTYQYHLLSYH